MNYSLFSSESVCAGHPDKICDQVSDTILDKALENDPRSRVAVETLVTKENIVIAGEVSSKSEINFSEVARKCINELGYTSNLFGFGPGTKVTTFINHQSPDIALGVDEGGAGDQGMMFGYAVNETPEQMPLPIVLAGELVKGMDKLQDEEKFLRPDGKSQVTVSYKNGKPVRIEKIVLAKPFDPLTSKTHVKEILYKKIVLPLLDKYNLGTVGIDNVILNGTGKWNIGGPASDTGVTGRKIVADTYGGMARIGGGCFSGKDPTKVDRSAAYAARYIAKNVVAAGLAARCEVQLAYVIGLTDPVAKSIETFGTGRTKIKVINDFAWSLIDLSVEGILMGLNLRRPIYKETARYGHFGNPEYPWEKLDLRL